MSDCACKRAAALRRAADRIESIARLGEIAEGRGAPAREGEVQSLLDRALVSVVPQEQGHVVEWERRSFSAGVPRPSEQHASAAYDRMIADLRAAVSRDESRLRELEGEAA